MNKKVINTKVKKPIKKSGFRMAFSKMNVQLGRIGKSLLFPIATLPIAAILLRIGSQLPTNTEFGDVVSSIIKNGGNVLFKNLHIVFAVGVAFGMTKDNRGEAALAGFIGIALLTLLMSSKGADLPNAIYNHVDFKSTDFATANSEGFHRIFTTTKHDAYDAILSENVLTGIIAGIIVSFIYNKFNGTELPKLLGFFSGRRLIPVLTVLITLVFGVLYAIIFPWIGYGLYLFSSGLSEVTGNRVTNSLIMGAYVTVNRLLIPFGLHHIPNTLFWFTLPVLNTQTHQIILDATNNPVSGDIFAFLNGVPENNPAGTFQTGFFPVMMFAIPALAVVFYMNAENKLQKRRVMAIFGSAALVSFITGITEPLEFAFLFVSPLLFITHAVLSGIFGFITGLFGIQLGFGFSAGFIDYALSIPKSMDIIHANKEGIDAVMANPGWIFAIGGVAFITYLSVGNLFVRKLNLAVPGRGDNLIESPLKEQEVTESGALSNKAKMIVKGLGGWDNIVDYQNCATRLRYELRTMKNIDEKLIKKSGAMGFVKVNDKNVQVIIGPAVEILNNEIKTNIGKSLEFKYAEVISANVEVSLAKKIEVDIKSIMPGTARSLASLKDGVFSERMMGDGIVIDFPKDIKKAIIKAPMDGKVMTVFPTGHAYGIIDKNGVEILIHIGIDSVSLKGKAFKSLVIQDQEVKQGDPLVEVDIITLKKELKVISPIIINTSQDTIIKKASGKVTKNTNLLTIERKVK